MSEKQDIKEMNTEESTSRQEHAAEEKQAQQEQEPAAQDTAPEAQNKNEDQDELEKIKAEVAGLKDQNLRLYAEFENFRKRTAKERVELFGTANQELMSALLPVLDDFKRALKAQEDEAAREGMQLIYNKLEHTLKSKGLKPMDDTIGKDFDVDTMEAITRIPAPDKKQKGKVIDEVEKGFYLGNRILRYAKVVVGE